VQDDVLGKLPDRHVAVFVVWFNMVRTDERTRWPHDEIVDRRAIHFWDGRKTVGAALAARDELTAWRPVAWDVWALYPAGAKWDAVVPAPASSGRTIIRTRKELASAVAALPPHRLQ
jgi:hypothetical protein